MYLSYLITMTENPFFYKNAEFVVGEKYNTLLVERIKDSPKWPNEVYVVVKNSEYYAGEFISLQCQGGECGDGRTCSYMFRKLDGSEHVVWLDYVGRTRFRLVKI